MTRKDFILIARTINDLDLSAEDRLHVARLFSYRLARIHVSNIASTKTRFDREWFIDACMKEKTNA